ncbi:uncharacterized protein jdp2a isoform X2 [Siphateles boraxobius]|uniref:uncharacterized protein jdp2a isoform X2 n=1 Tax=Siphateles boraxobius TaxID=180520 RepID=UPI004062A681
MQRFPLFKIYSRPPADVTKGLQSLTSRPKSAVVRGVGDVMPGQIPDPSVTAGSLPSLGPLVGISATTLTQHLKYADLYNLGAMLSPLHLLGKLGKRPLPIKAECISQSESLKVQLYIYRKMKRKTGGKEGEKKTKWQQQDVETKRKRERSISKGNLNV